jgi:anti-anti-sigma factor
MSQDWVLRYAPQLMPLVKLDLEKLPGSDGKSLVIRLKGKLTLETASHFLQTVRPEPASYLILDMSEVSFLDSAGVGALVQLFVHRRNGGKRFALAALTQQGKAILQVAGLTKLLPIRVSVEEALAQAE